MESMHKFLRGGGFTKIDRQPPILTNSALVLECNSGNLKECILYIMYMIDSSHASI